LPALIGGVRRGPEFHLKSRMRLPEPIELTSDHLGFAPEGASGDGQNATALAAAAGGGRGEQDEARE
jgi:hypothetical protein